MNRLTRTTATNLRVTVLGVGCLLLAGCTSEGVSGGDDDCTSHYDVVARAATLPRLKSELRRDVSPTVTSLHRVADKGDKRVINLLNAKQRVVMEVDVWQRADGTWVAGQWAQCTD
jgi:hypothetical protein